MRSSVCGVSSPLRWWWLLKARLRRFKGHQLCRSLPPEVQLDILRCLKRFDLDAVQFSSQQLRTFLEVLSAHLPLRNIDRAVVCTRQCTWFKSPNVVASNGRELRLSTKKSSIEEQMCFIMKAIQDAYVAKLEIGCIDRWTFRKRIGEWGVQTITLATVSAKMQNVSVHDLHIHNSESDYHSDELSGIIMAFRRVDLVRCDVAYPQFLYEAILRRYQTRGMPFPGLATYGCNFPNAHSGIHGYCSSDRRPHAAPIFERPTSDYHLLAPDLIEKMYRFKCVTIIFYRVNDVPIKQ